MDLELLIALSHLRSRRQDAGISLIALLSMVGVTVGVAVLIIVLSVMEGFEIELRKKILGNQAHLLVLSYGGPVEEPDELVQKVEAVPGITAVTPFTYSEVMLKTPGGVAGAILKGIDPARALNVNDIASDIRLGPDSAPSTPEARRALVTTLHAPPVPAGAEALPGIILGDTLAGQLKVHPGEQLLIINPVGGGMGPFGMPIPSSRAYRVAALTHTGMFEYDTKWSYIALADAQEFMQLPNAATGLEARVQEDLIWEVPEVSMRVEQATGPLYYSKNWLTMNEALFKALAMEKWVMGLILGQIVSVAALGIVTNLIVMVITRAREISILRAMGATTRMITSVFVLEGTVVGLVGTSLGVGLGLAGCAFLSGYHYALDTNVYYLDSLPVVIVPQTVAVVAVGAAFVCFLATLYPSTRAARLPPVDGLRYE